MRKAASLAGAIILLAAITMSAAQADLDVELKGFKLANLPGVKASLITPAPQGAALAVRFTKASEERRLLALEIQPDKSLDGARALAAQLQVQILSGEAPKLALIIFDADGGSWYRVGAHPVTVDEMAETRLSVTGMRETAFSEDTSGELEWDNVKKLWLGVVIDGPASGILQLRSARFTDQPYKPTKPLRITGDGPGEWSVSANPAVTGGITTPNEGPDGTPCMKYEFNAPGGEHRWMIPGTPVPAAELEGYTALRFKYRAQLPAGIGGLLVMVGETGGSQWCANPPPPPSEEWTEIVIPFFEFTLGNWTKDANNKLDLDLAQTISIGAHGVPAGAGGPGLIMATDIEFIP